jgi:hypothetical protein
MMEQEWQQECQMLLNPEQPIIDHEKLTLSKPASHVLHVINRSVGIKIFLL